MNQRLREAAIVRCSKESAMKSSDYITLILVAEIAVFIGAVLFAALG